MTDVAAYRAAFAAVVVVSSLLLVGAAVPAATGAAPAQTQSPWSLSVADDYDTSNPGERSTVVTAHVAGGDIWQFALNGTLLYHDDTRDGYWDVDPVPGEQNTVVYAATDEVHDESRCEPLGDEGYCIRQIIERANLTTGETEVLYSRVDPWYRFHEWHDVDRVGNDSYAVADMYANEVFFVNVSTGIVTWEWNTQNNFSLESGDQYPNDWDHINDVEVLEDGRVMISPRNHDQVLFLDQQTGLQENWTIGADDQFSTLDGQHNPDYLSEEDGGPAVLIADSNNDRAIEYARTENGSWTQSWVWQDEKLTWPRDADRLPNGHTLVTDTRGGRVVEVDESGEVVWNLTHEAHDEEGSYVAYEAERLNTGDESAGGESAESLGLQSRTVDDSDRPENQSAAAASPPDTLLPEDARNAVASNTPPWMGVYELGLLALLGVTAVAWLAVELWVAGVRLRLPIARE